MNVDALFLVGIAGPNDGGVRSPNLDAAREVLLPDVQ
jgi:hypothetical protein